jgi:hypothetical protein
MNILYYFVYTNQYKTNDGKKLLSQKKGAPPCTQVCGNVQDRYQQNWGAMKNYLKKNQESHLKIEIIQFQMEDISPTPSGIPLVNARRRISAMPLANT